MYLCNSICKVWYFRYPKEEEFHLKNAKPRTHKKVSKSTIFDPGCTRYDLPKVSPLPPIEPKPQVCTLHHNLNAFYRCFY